ncbi:MAG TPA: cysteine--tRNA ligase [Pirellulales bacterium]|nr:cysteine--tRNA ligase [Pirellulales bacterium]
MSTATSRVPSSTANPPAAALRVYSTLTRTKEPFVPVKPGQVGMYLCGPTVYKPSHIGHMVGPVIFDAIKRYLVYLGYKVTWVVNVTDVDDKLIKESAARNMTMAKLAEEMTADYMHNLAALGVDTIDHFPKATDNIDEIIQLTKVLIDKGFAYASEGDVYFDVAKDSGYGKLSRRTTESLQGEGGDMAGRKRSPGDFALWKSAKPGEPAWDSPWGKGRPGWHIECSAMSRRILGETFDIHGGGLDLIFPHHENEIAQSECAHGKPQAKYWLHNGLMQAAAEAGKIGGRNTRAADSANPQADDLSSQPSAKISKSTGASAFRDLLSRHQPETIRFFLLSTHYRSPIQYSEELLQETAISLDRFYRFFKRFERVTGRSFYVLQPAATRMAGEFNPASPGAPGLLAEVAALRQKFVEAMDDDFNTGAAASKLFELLGALNKFVDTEKLEAGQPDAAKLAALEKSAAVLKELAGVLGLFRKPVEQKSAGGDDALTAQVVQLATELHATGKLGADKPPVAGAQLDELMKLLIDARAAARKNKDFATGDLIRNRLKAMGITLEDRPGGTQWNRA